MPKFLKVRAVSGPLHEFFAAAEEVEVNPDLYEVLDSEPVDYPGPVVYVVPEPALPREPIKSVGKTKKELS